MQLEILTREDLQRELQSFRSQIISDIRELSSKGVRDQWLTGREAKLLLKVGSTKLSQMVSLGIISDRGYGCGKRYSRESIINYINTV